MDDIEERPCKIRKLDTVDSLEEHSELAEDPIEEEDQSLDAATIPVSNEPQENGSSTTQPTLSKSALKKLRRKEAWAAGADDRRLKRREKHKEKQARKATAKIELEAKIASGELPAPPPQPARPFARPTQVPVGLILDCGFDELMTEKELISLASQVTRCYSENRSARYRTHLCISSWGGHLRERFETVLDNNHQSWKGVLFEEGGFIEAGKVVNTNLRGKNGGKVIGALEDKGNGEINEQKESLGAGGSRAVTDNKLSGENQVPSMLREDVKDARKKPENTDVDLPDLPLASTNAAKTSTNGIPPSLDAQPPKLVYLSSDSPDTLESLSPYTSYIIGGLVDKNRHKGICYKRAMELGIPTAKLPIGEYMEMQSRKVLAINHVVEIILRWLEEGDWGAAFERVIPKRKGGRRKTKVSENGEAAQGEDEDDVGSDQEEDVEVSAEPIQT